MVLCSYLRISLICLCTAVFISAPARAQDTQLWTALFANGQPNDDSRLLLWFDGHARYINDVDRLGVSIIRPGVGTKINSSLSLWAGYAWVVSRAADRPSITEHRLWQQATYTALEGKWGRLSGRTRLEQRFLETGDDTGWRVRQFFRWAKPVSPRWTLTAWNETFIALNDTDFGAEGGYDQNRFFAGARWRATSRLSLEGGYLLNHLNRAVDETNHNISLSFVLPL
ncbi:MAG: DUF2490 domain-containing protein [Pseudomonadota bacterium]